MRSRWWSLMACVALGCTHDFDSFTPVQALDATAADTGVLDAADTAPFRCDAPAKSYGGHCYFPLNGAGVAWDDARKACEAASAHLATVTSTGEEGLVESIVPGNDRWIGLRRDVGSPGIDASYHWITGEPSIYKSWSAGEPNGGGECVRLLTGGHWGDHDCTTKFLAICERE